MLILLLTAFQTALAAQDRDESQDARDTSQDAADMRERRPSVDVRERRPAGEMRERLLDDMR